MVARFCSADFKEMLEIKDGKMVGMFAEIYNSIFQGLRRHLNVTLRSDSKLGDMDPKTGRYDGCLGQVQRNESDTHMPVAALPLIADGLAQGHISHPSKMMIGSVYDINVPVSASDVMDAFQAFTPDLWVATSGMTALLALIVFGMHFTDLMTRRTRRCKQAQVWWINMNKSAKQVADIVIANSLKQHTAYSDSYKRTGERMVVLMFAIFTFLIRFYFSSMIKTDMVVQKAPVTISTYEEILARKDVKPLWLMQMTDHVDFMNADPQTPEGRIWERAKRKGIENCRMDANADNVQQVTAGIAEQKTVVLAASHSMGSIVSNGCAVTRSMGIHLNLNAWVKSDPRAKETLNAFMVPSVIDKRIAYRLYRVVQMLFESYITIQDLKRTDFVMARDTGSESVRDCLSNRIILKDHEVSFPEVSHYRNLLLGSSIALLLALLLLLLEHVAAL